MSDAILDASALLAVLRSEPGAERVQDRLTCSLISAVNLSEVVAKAIDYGGSLEAVSALLGRLPFSVVPFTDEHAYLAASLRAPTRPLGLSLGDRACLALGLKTGFPVLSTEQVWAKLDVGVTVELIR